MKKIFAIPILDGIFCSHFGGSDSFAIIETEDGKILNNKIVKAPDHERGAYPRFLASLGVNIIIAGGMGTNAKNIFDRYNIEVCLGVNPDEPIKLVEDYLRNTLVSSVNLCNHEEHHNHCHNCRN